MVRPGWVKPPELSAEIAHVDQRLAAPDVLQVTRAFVLRLVRGDALRQIAVIDLPGAREIMRSHRGRPLAIDGLVRMRHRR